MFVSTSNHDNSEINDPNELKSLIQNLDYNENDFIVLSKDDNHFIQAAGDSKYGYLVEYKGEDSKGIINHFISKNEDINQIELTRLFISFYKNENIHSDFCKWSIIESD